MPTNRQPLRRRGLSLDEFEISELLSGHPPLLGGFGFSGDARAIRLAWRRRETELLRLWRQGWKPASKFANWKIKDGPRPAVPPGYQLQVNHADKPHPY